MGVGVWYFFIGFVNILVVFSRWMILFIVKVIFRIVLWNICFNCFYGKCF